MESDHSLREFFYKTRNRLWTNNTLVLLVCIFIAFIFWLLTALSRTYLSDIDVEASYINRPQDKVLVNRLPDELQMQVRSTGWMLLREAFNIDDLSISVDVSRYSEDAMFFPNADLEYLNDRFPDAYQIIRVAPSQIRFAFDERATRKVPVAFNYRVTLDPLYGFSDSIAIEPDSIVVSGPQVIVDTISRIETQPLQLEAIKENTSGTVGIKKLNSAVLTYEPEKVRYEIKIEPFTETSLQVPIRTINTGGAAIILVQKNAIVSFQIPLKNFDMVDKDTFRDDFDVVADFGNIDSAENTVRLEVLSTPELVKKVQVSPREVNFLYIRE